MFSLNALLGQETLLLAKYVKCVNEDQEVEDVLLALEASVLPEVGLDVQEEASQLI